MNRDDEDEDDGAGAAEALSADEMALFAEEPTGGAPPDAAAREAKRAADAAERGRLKAQGLLRHDGEEIAVLAVGDAWRAFLLSDPRGSVGDGDTPGAALADLKEKLAAR